MVRFFRAPTMEEEVLKVRDFRDTNYNSQMEHAEELLDFKSKHDLAFEKMAREHKRSYNKK
jgi:hypothetical protein